MSKNEQVPAVKSPDGLKLVITIVDREKSEFYADLIQNGGANLQCFLSAHGTARSQMLEMLGLANDRKSVILSMISAERVPELLSMLSRKFKSVKGGTGIAFSIPFSSMIGATAYRFLSDKRETQRLL